LFFPMNSYDKVYISKIFNFTPMPTDVMCEQVIIGGTGFDISIALSPEIEGCQPDYSIYPNCNYSLQLFSRGCPRNCKFCVVPAKEGRIRPVWPMAINRKGKWIEVLDNNFFANPEWRGAIEYLKIYNQPVNFHGIDARNLWYEPLDVLSKLRHHKQIKMAWDNANDKIDWAAIIKIIPAWKIMVYVLIGFNSTPEEDMERVKIIDSLGMDPFVMPFDKSNPYQRQFARWVNHRAIFKSTSFENYNRKPVAV
jgi:hypothetical protein